MRLGQHGERLSPLLKVVFIIRQVGEAVPKWGSACKSSHGSTVARLEPARLGIPNLADPSPTRAEWYLVPDRSPWLDYMPSLTWHTASYLA